MAHDSDDSRRILPMLPKPPKHRRRAPILGDLRIHGTVPESDTTLFEVWIFLGALQKLEVPGKSARSEPVRLFDTADLRSYRDAVFAAMDSDDQLEAMNAMPSAAETVSALLARQARRDREGEAS